MLLTNVDLTAGQYRVVIVDDPAYEVGSADNVHTYDHEYVLDNSSDRYTGTSRHAVRVLEADTQIASCIVVAGRGPSGVHEHSAVILDDVCIVAVGPFTVSLRVPMLELQWATETDEATCFGVHYSAKHRCIISHGELEIARLSVDGHLVWRSSGADIFTNGFKLHDNSVQAIDFDDREYTFDIETGREHAV